MAALFTLDGAMVSSEARAFEHDAADIHLQSV